MANVSQVSCCWIYQIQVLIVGLSLNDIVQINFSNWIYDPRSYSKFKVMVEVQYTLSRSKGRAEDLGNSLGDRADITQPALQ